MASEPDIVAESDDGERYEGPKLVGWPRDYRLRCNLCGESAWANGRTLFLALATRLVAEE